MAKALTLHQPWASLVALGVKTIETRSWTTRYRGRLLIHAGRRPPEERKQLGDWVVLHPQGEGPSWPWRMAGPTPWDSAVLPLGAVVASCELVDVVPIAHLPDFPQVPTIDVDYETLRRFYGESDPRGVLREWIDESGQWPYGDFTPGRYAWLLGDAKKVEERCPRCWGEGDIRWPLGPDERGVPQDVICATCDGEGRCEPVPARGRQGLWEWTP